MAPRSFWKGYLKLSLVTCPVAMMPATTEGERIRFHTLNRKTGHRIESRYVDAVTEKPVDPDEETKGYERGENDYVVVTDDDLDAVALDSTRTIDIDTFVPADSIGWIWYDKPHYLTPDDPVGEEAFAVIRDAMAATKTVGIARLVLYRRERAVMLVPRDKGIILWTLHYGDEVREAPALDRTAEAKPDPKAKSLIDSLMKDRTREWDPTMLSDPVQGELQKLIASKQKGKKAPKRKPEPVQSSSNVVDIMDALRKSLAADKKHTPAK